MKLFVILLINICLAIFKFQGNIYRVQWENEDDQLFVKINVNKLLAYTEYF